MALLSLVIPCYNEQETIALFYQEARNYATELFKKYQLETEYIFVDDGSSDETLAEIKKLPASNVHYIEFSRNFGKEAAIYAGLQKATGDYVALLDADLQDPPYLLEEMYLAVKEQGFDCAATYRSSRKGEPPMRSFFAKKFYDLINKFSNTNIKNGSRDYRFMNRNMVNAILELKEYNRFSKGIFAWVGFKTYWIAYENIERVAGATKWSFWKLFLYSLDGILGFSTAPLAIASFIGMFFCIISIFMFLLIFIKTLIFGDPVQGFPTLICTVILVGGIQLFCLGIIGQYLARLFMQSKNRPIYIIRSEK